MFHSPEYPRTHPYARTHTHTRTRTHAGRIHTLHMYAHMYTFTYACTYTHVHVYTHTRRHTHTHTHNRRARQEHASLTLHEGSQAIMSTPKTITTRVDFTALEGNFAPLDRCHTATA